MQRAGGPILQGLHMRLWPLLGPYSCAELPLQPVPSRRETAKTGVRQKEANDLPSPRGALVLSSQSKSILCYLFFLRNGPVESSGFKVLGWVVLLWKNPMLQSATGSQCRGSWLWLRGSRGLPPLSPTQFAILRPSAKSVACR